MNGARRFFRRYIVSTVGILALFLAVNGLLILWVLAAGSRERIAETFSIKELSSHISCENGVWAAGGAVSDLLEQQDAWAMILDETGAVVWERNLPENLPRRYTAAEVASFSSLRRISRSFGALIPMLTFPPASTDRMVMVM